MKKIIIAVVLAAIATPASAQMTHYLVRQWFSGGNQFCQYSNGTVLNMGARICPLSIRG